MYLGVSSMSAGRHRVWSDERIVKRRNIIAGGTTQTGRARTAHWATACSAPNASAASVGSVKSITIIANANITRRSFALSAPSFARSARR